VEVVVAATVLQALEAVSLGFDQHHPLVFRAQSDLGDEQERLHLVAEFAESVA
jgi:hypothetical protein